MIQLDRIEDSEGIDLEKTDKSKECKICHYNDFDNGFKSDSKIFNRCDLGIKSFGNLAIIHVNVYSYRFFMFDMTEEDVIEFIKDFESDDEFETTLQYEKIDVSEGIDIHKTNASRECMLCHYWYFEDVRFKFKQDVCNACSIGCMFSKSKRTEILNVKGVDYTCILCGISRNKAVDILNNSVLEGKGVIILNNSVLEDRGWINEINTYDWF